MRYLLIFVLTSFVFAQNVKDLQVGNKFIYHRGHYGEDLLTGTLFDTWGYNYYELVEKDTTINQLIFYKIYNSEENQYYYERADSTKIYQFSDSLKILFSYDVSVGDSIYFDRFNFFDQYNFVISLIRQTDILNTYILRIVASNETLPYQASVSFVKKFGLYKFETRNMEYFSNWVIIYDYRMLVGAVLGDSVFGDTTITNLENYSNNVPQKFNFINNFPNPFNNSTNIICQVINYSEEIEITIYNILGQKTITLFKGKSINNPINVTWDGRNSSGEYVNSGIYICRVKSRFTNMSHKIVLIK